MSSGHAPGSEGFAGASAAAVEVGAAVGAALGVALAGGIAAGGGGAGGAGGAGSRGEAEQALARTATITEVRGLMACSFHAGRADASRASTDARDGATAVR